MEETQNQQETQAPVQTVVPTPTQQQVAYRQNPKGKGKKSFALVLMIISLLLVGGGVFYFLGQKSSGEAGASPTPEVTFGGVEEETPAPIESASPAPVDKTEISIEVQNGTGIPKEASYVQGLLRDLGYEKVEVGNSEKQDYTNTEVTFSSKLSSTAVSEITGLLEKTYKTVKTSTSSTIKSDVIIITGLRKGATPKASSTPTTVASSTPKASTTSTATPTATPTEAPTATPQ